MSGFTVRRGVREKVPLFIGVTGGTGSGKTKSAMRLATGIVGRDKRFGVIDTESGRASHYAPRPDEKPDFVNTFNFDVIELEAPYSSERYEEALLALKDYPCIVVDQASFEHTGIGGHLEAHENIVQEKVKRAKSKGDKREEWQLEEAYKQAAWIPVKAARRRLINQLIAIRAPVIFCFRASEKMQIVERVEKGNNGREYKKTDYIAAKDRPLTERWVPECGKEFEPEMLAHFLVLRDHPEHKGLAGRGIPVVLKLNDQHSDFVDLTKPLDEAAGKRFAVWANGGATTPGTGTAPLPSQQTSSAPKTDAGATGNEQPDVQFISVDAVIDLRDKFKEAGIAESVFCAAAKVAKLELLPAKNSKGGDNYDGAVRWIQRESEKK